MPCKKLFLLPALLLCLAACSEQQAANAPELPFRLTATIQEIMNSEVDPAADYIWGSTGFVSTAQGTVDKTPKTDQDWAVLRHNALTLIEATNLLVMEGRLVAHKGSTLDEGEKAGIEDPDEIQKMIDANRANFIGFAHALHDVGMEVLKAIDAKDIAGVDALGEKLDMACEQCHRTYWYPGAVEPTQIYDPNQK